MSRQKLCLLEMSLQNRLRENPGVASIVGGEQNGGGVTASPVTTLPRLAQLSGTLYLKLVGVEGLIDLCTLRQANQEMDVRSPPPRTYSASMMSKNNTRFKTLPNPHRSDRERDKERSGAMADDEAVPRQGRRGSKAKKNSLQKQHSLDHIDDVAGKESSIH